MTPVRICDTRAGNPSQLSGDADQCSGGTEGERLGAGKSFTFDVGGEFDVPAAATAVVLTVHAVNPSTAGFFTVYPAGQVKTVASDLNFAPGQVVANLVETAVGSDGGVSLYSSAPTDAVVDLEGYVTPTLQDGSGLYNPLSDPARICDTRGSNPSHLTGRDTQCNTDVATGGPDNLIGPTDALTITVAGAGGVPQTGVSAVVLNVTVAEPRASGYVTVYPAQTKPSTSNINFAAGQVVPDRVTLFATAPTDLIVDVSGYYTAAGGTTGYEFTPEVTPDRICDTRGSDPSDLVAPYTQCNADTTEGSPDNPLAPGSHTMETVGLGGVPTGASAAVLNVTAVAPSAPCYLVVYPSGTRPDTSDLDPPVGGVSANLVVASLSASGSFLVANESTGDTNLVVALEGWYPVEAQSSLNRGLTDAKVEYDLNGQTYPSTAATVAVLAVEDPGLSFTTSGSTAPTVISVTTSEDGNSIILAAQDPITGTCWYVVDNLGATGTASPPWSDPGALFVSPGTWFGELENTETPPSCSAPSAPGGPNSGTQAFLTTGFPDL